MIFGCCCSSAGGGPPRAARAVLTSAPCPRRRLGAAEAALLCAQPLSQFGASHAHFVCAYASENMLSSVIWSTKPAGLVAASCELDAHSLLLPSLCGGGGAEPPGAEEAASLLRAQGAATGRSIIAGWMGMAQVSSRWKSGRSHCFHGARTVWTS